MDHADWPRIADDLRRSTGRELEVRFVPDESGFEMAEVTIDGRRCGAVGRSWFADSTEERLAILADVLQEQFLHEEVWGGWPLCSRHVGRPMWAGIGSTGRASWICEVDGQEVEIGQLAPPPRSTRRKGERRHR
jgi:hypothetical protein